MGTVLGTVLKYLVRETDSGRPALPACAAVVQTFFRLDATRHCVSAAKAAREALALRDLLIDQLKVRACVNKQHAAADASARWLVQCRAGMPART